MVVGGGGGEETGEEEGDDGGDCGGGGGGGGDTGGGEAVIVVPPSVNRGQQVLALLKRAALHSPGPGGVRHSCCSVVHVEVGCRVRQTLELLALLTLSLRPETVSRYEPGDEPGGIAKVGAGRGSPFNVARTLVLMHVMPARWAGWRAHQWA